MSTNNMLAFPSPCGEKVGINEIAKLNSTNIDTVFPSPCGEKVGINMTKLRIQRGEYYEVSVPLRGKGRDQRD